MVAWEAFVRYRAPEVSASPVLRVALTCLVLTASPALGQSPTGVPLECPSPIEVLVERSFAGAEGLEVGDLIRLGAQPVTLCDGLVVGTFEPEADPAALARGRPRILLHLSALTELVGRAGEVDRFSISLKPGHDPDSTAAVIESLMPGAQVLPASRVAEGASATFEVIRRFHRAIAVITLTASGVFLACIMILKVQERRVQVSALRLVGVSNQTLMRWLLAEATVISILGGLLGLGIGQLASLAINSWYQRVYDTQLVFSLVTAETLTIGLILAVVLGVVAGGISTLSVLRLKPLAEAGR